MIGSYCGLCQLRFSGFSLTAACHHSVHFEISGSGVREGAGLRRHDFLWGQFKHGAINYEPQCTAFHSYMAH